MDQIFPKEWLQLFGGVDLGVMVVIGVIAYTMERSMRFSDAVAMLIPLGLGGVWGLVEATQAGYGTVAHVLKGIMMNGGFASVVARYVNFVLQKWDKANGNGLPLPKE